MNSQKILIIHTAFIGDLILSTGFIREARKGFPCAQIDLVTTPVSAGLFRCNPHLNNVYSFDKKGIKGLFNQYRLVKFLKAIGYDTAFSLHLSLRSSLILKQTGIPIRIGHHRMVMLTHPVQVERKQHIKDRYLSILRPFIDFKPDSDTELHIGRDESEMAEKLIGNSEEFRIGIAPGSIRNTKRWPEAYFSSLTRDLYDKMNIFFIGGSEDRELCGKIISQNGGKAVNLAGKLSLLGSAAVIRKLDLLLTNDSAPLHMANAVDTSVIALFGPTVREFGYSPYRQDDQMLEVELDCRPCGKHGGARCPRGHFKCMLDIKPEYVLQKILEFKKHHKKG